LSARGIAYLHGAKQGGYEVHAHLRPLFKGLYFAGAGFEKASGDALLESGGGDAIVYGKPYIANPDLVNRMRSGLALAEPDGSTIYGGGAKGYVDYPAAD
jgi:N-ethylmaleimide reductase